MAIAVNDRGQVVGESYLWGSQRDWPLPSAHAFLWTEGQMLDLGTLGGVDSKANDINNSGHVVGWADGSGTDTDASLWKNGVMTSIHSSFFAEAVGINDQGQIVGWASDFKSEDYAFSWKDGKTTPLPVGHGAGAKAYAVNDDGVIVGEVTLGDDQTHAAIWRGGRLNLLRVRGSNWSKACAVNATGLVVGELRFEPPGLSGFGWKGFLYKDGRIRELVFSSRYAFLSNDDRARAVNRFGQVVGRGRARNSNLHAWLWQDRVFIDLNDLIASGTGWGLHVATDINNVGHIVGYGRSPRGETHGFLLTPLR